MARHYYDINKGDGFNPKSVAVSTSAGSGSVEISTLDGAGLTKIDVLNAIEALEAYFEIPNNSVTG